MSLAIVLGFSGTKRTDPVTNLYTGNDLAAARNMLESPPAGIGRTEMIVNPAPARRKIHVPEAPVEDPAPVEQPPVEPPAVEESPGDQATAPELPIEEPPAETPPAREGGKKK